MDKEDLIQIKDIRNFNFNKKVMYDSLEDVVGVYKKEELTGFGEKIIDYIERCMDIIDDFFYDVEQKIDDIIGIRLLELYDKVLELSEKQINKVESDAKKVSTLKKLKPMFPKGEVDELDIPSEMREFKLEDYCGEEYRSRYSKKKSRKGSLSVFLAMLISVVVIGIILFIKIISV